MADAFSRLPQTGDAKLAAPAIDFLFTDEWEQHCRTNPASTLCHIPRAEFVEKENPKAKTECLFGDELIEECLLNLPTDDSSIYDCFLNLPDMPLQVNPLNLRWIKEIEDNDPRTSQIRANLGRYYHLQTFGDFDLICCANPGEDQETQWRIVLTDETVGPAVQWFHQVLGNSGQQCLLWTMQARYYHPSMRRQIKQLNCNACQQYKHNGPAYGHLPPQEAMTSNWYEVAVDCIGPWKVDIRDKEYEFNALTCTDTASNLTEIIRVDHKTAEHMQDKFDQAWMCRYPWMQRLIHDGGPEFIGHEF